MISAALGPYSDVGLEVISEIGRPTVLLGPNNSGKSRYLELVEALLQSHLPEYRHATSPDIPVRRMVAEKTAETIEPTFRFELDQLDLPGSWDREFFAMHAGPHLSSRAGEAAQVSPEVAIEQTLRFLGEEDEDGELFHLRSADPKTKADYLRLVEETLRVCRYVITGPSEQGEPLAHWPAMHPDDLPGLQALAQDLYTRVIAGPEGSLAKDFYLPCEAVMRIAAIGGLPTEPFSPGWHVCDGNDYKECHFPDFEIIRLGPGARPISSLLDEIAACVLDQEGVSQPRRLTSGNGLGAYGVGEALFRLMEEGVLPAWAELITDLCGLHSPEFVRRGFSPRFELSIERLARDEGRLHASLTEDPDLQLGSGLRNWFSYALARTAAELRRRRRLVPGGRLHDAPHDRPVTTERPLLLLFDEPEVHLHVGLQRAVAEWIAEESLKPNQTVMVATHSPAFLSMSPADARFVPLIDGKGQAVPKESVDLLKLAGASGADLASAVRGFLFVEGKHEKKLYSACFGTELAERNIYVVCGSGAFGAAGQCNFLSVFGKRIAVVLDRVRREIVEATSRPWPRYESSEEKEVQKIYDLEIENVRCIPFPYHDVIQVVDPEVIRSALKRLRLPTRSEVWKWSDVLERYEAERTGMSGERKPDFKRVFLKHLGLASGTSKDIGDRFDEIVDVVCDLFVSGTPAPMGLKAVFAQATDYLEGNEGFWNVTPEP